MPPLLTPSPTILDQTFPKDLEHLNILYRALGQMELLLSQNLIHVLLPNSLAEWMLEYEWSPPENCLALNDLYRFISQLFLNPNDGFVQVDLTDVVCNEEESHPPLGNYKNIGMSWLWCLEMGKLFKVHKSVSEDTFFIGIGCEYGLCGERNNQHGKYKPINGFPIVGINNIDTLADAYDWIVEPDILKRSVSFAQAKKNIFLLGATKISKPRSGSSHYPVHFAGARSWPLDSNDDPVPLQYLRELVPITKRPINVIVHVLLYGNFPQRRLKIPEQYVAG